MQGVGCRMQNARCKIYNAFVLLFGIGVWVNLRGLRNLYFLFFEMVERRVDDQAPVDCVSVLGLAGRVCVSHNGTRGEASGRGIGVDS
jgi:hypothetical protein